MEFFKDIIKNKKLIMQLGKNDFKNRKIIFTGAGTSEFVGNSITPALGGNVLSIATTDIVSNPENYLKKDLQATQSQLMIFLNKNFLT